MTDTIICIKDQFIDIILEKNITEKDLDYIFECVKDEYHFNLPAWDSLQ